MGKDYPLPLALQIVNVGKKRTNRYESLSSLHKILFALKELITIR